MEEVKKVIMTIDKKISNEKMKEKKYRLIV